VAPPGRASGGGALIGGHVPRGEMRPRKLLGPILLLAIWYAIFYLRVFSPILLPAPHKIVEALIALIRSGELWYQVFTSWRRQLTGFFLAVSVGVSLGMAIGWWRFLADVIDIPVNSVRAIPPIAMMPLALIWLGVGEPITYFLVFYAAVFPILINSMSRVKGVDKVLVRAALTLGADETFLLRKVILPAALPSIMTGCRIGLGISWAAIVTAELISSSRGLGFMIEYYRLLIHTENVIVAMGMMGLLGYLSDRGFLWVERKIFPWYAGSKIR
jgi:ABC-type nitrate/sulfonate/bicarbonate transport system permease component